MKYLVYLLLLWPLMAAAKSIQECELALKPLPMMNRYRGENEINFHALSAHAARRVPPGLEGSARPAPTHVVYLPAVERGRQEIRIGADGLFRWASGGLVSASQPPALFVVMNVGGEVKMFLWPNPAYRRYQHSTLSAGMEVLMAGEMNLVDGRLIFMSNRSGHYEPTAEALRTFESWLRRRGADLSRTEVRPFVQH